MSNGNWRERYDTRLYRRLRQARDLHVDAAADEKKGLEKLIAALNLARTRIANARHEATAKAYMARLGDQFPRPLINGDWRERHDARLCDFLRDAEDLFANANANERRALNERIVAINVTRAKIARVLHPETAKKHLSILYAQFPEIHAFTATLVLPLGRAASSRHAEIALDLLSALVPKRIATEEVGDALEYINKMRAMKKPSWLVFLKVVSTFWWVIIHTLLHYTERIAGIMKTAIGKSGSADDSKK
ncbi:hypothetical protein [Melittangium boletus]|uniref:hypothetical protein n=1 Tax=Melittangium boletus TaxID=83453 RepID=UPI003DA442D6